MFIRTSGGNKSGTNAQIIAEVLFYTKSASLKPKNKIK